MKSGVKSSVESGVESSVTEGIRKVQELLGWPKSETKSSKELARALKELIQMMRPRYRTLRRERASVPYDNTLDANTVEVFKARGYPTAKDDFVRLFRALRFVHAEVVRRRKASKPKRIFMPAVLPEGWKIGERCGVLQRAVRTDTYHSPRDREAVPEVVEMRARECRRSSLRAKTMATTTAQGPSTIALPPNWKMGSRCGLTVKAKSNNNYYAPRAHTIPAEIQGAQDRCRAALTSWTRAIPSAPRVVQRRRIAEDEEEEHEEEEKERPEEEEEHKEEEEEQEAEEEQQREAKEQEVKDWEPDDVQEVKNEQPLVNERVELCGFFHLENVLTVLYPEFLFLQGVWRGTTKEEQRATRATLKIGAERNLQFIAELWYCKHLIPELRKQTPHVMLPLATDCQIDKRVLEESKSESEDVKKAHKLWTNIELPDESLGLVMRCAPGLRLDGLLLNFRARWSEDERKAFDAGLLVQVAQALSVFEGARFRHNALDFDHIYCQPLNTPFELPYRKQKKFSVAWFVRIVDFHQASLDEHPNLGVSARRRAFDPHSCYDWKKFLDQYTCALPEVQTHFNLSPDLDPHKFWRSCECDMTATRSLCEYNSRSRKTQQASDATRAVKPRTTRLMRWNIARENFRTLPDKEHKLDIEILRATSATWYTDSIIDNFFATLPHVGTLRSMELGQGEVSYRKAPPGQRLSYLRATSLVFEHSVVLVPANESGKHWVLYVVYTKQQEVQYWDSLGSNKTKIDDESSLEKFLLDLWKVPSLKPVISMSNLPRQPNGSDCGPFVCGYARYIANNKDALLADPTNPMLENPPEINGQKMRAAVRSVLFANLLPFTPKTTEKT